MFERFDHRARTVLVLAQDEARRLNHSVIDVEHLLLGVASVDPDLVGIHVTQLREVVAAARGMGREPDPSQALPFTLKTKRVLAAA